MINGKRAIGIIPARGGSKGLPGKNVRELCGKPLIAWSIQKALASSHLDVVMVTTDDTQIAEVARRHGAAVPFMRPAELATDVASTYDVIRHAIEHYRRAGEAPFEYTVLLEPTSPLREDDDIDRMLAALDAASDDFDAIVSLGEVTTHPSVMKRVVEGRMEAFHPALGVAGRRQDHVPAYFPFGVAYIAKTDVLLRDDTFYTQRCLPFVIRRYQNYEIDDLYDLLCVENVMRHEWGLA